MSREESYKPGVTSIFDLTAQFDLDRQRPEAELRRRDREIGQKLAALRRSPRKQVIDWLSHVSDQRNLKLGARLAKALRIGTFLLGIAGLIIGWLTATAVFYYDGSQPVNVINILAVFVGAQLVLILLLFFTFIPPSVLRWLPGARSAVETLELLSPGRLQRLASRFLPEEHKRRAENLLGTSRAHRVLFGRIERWLVTSSSQFFGVTFNIGALLSCLYLIFFSDLAFSWSTTLQVTAEDIHSLTRLLAAPWSRLVPDADPSLSLIEASRYYRLKEALPFPGGETPTGPAILGGWWPFLVMCMLSYGLIPRLALRFFSGWRLRCAVNHTILHLPGVKDLLYRMNRELVETQSGELESVKEAPRADAEAPSTGSLQGSFSALINWGEVPLSDDQLSRIASLTCGCSSTAMFAAGGANSLAQDDEVIVKASNKSVDGGIIVFVKAWEPPLKDLHDFLVALRNNLPETSPIVIIPLNIDQGANPGPPGQIQLETWRTSMQKLGDPWLSVKQPSEGSS
jgi:hypothetical protein